MHSRVGLWAVLLLLLPCLELGPASHAAARVAHCLQYSKRAFTCAGMAYVWIHVCPDVFLVGCSGVRECARWSDL